ncbi:MAG: PEP-CTERM sorting domain-containing protein [Puniceicoccales bacterium]
MKTFFTLPLAAASLLILATTASAATLGYWDAPVSTTPSSPEYTINDAVVPASSPFTYSTVSDTWFSYGNDSDLLNVYNEGWTVAQQQAAAVAAGVYIEFSLTADESTQFDITTIEARISGQSLSHSTTEPIDVYAFVRTSVDDYATTVADASVSVPYSLDGDTSSKYATATSSSLSSEYSSITGTVTFRVYYYVDTVEASVDQIARLYSLTVDGTTSAIPEPATMGLFGGAFALAVLLWVRRRR